MLLAAWENEQAIIEKKEKEVSYMNEGLGREQQISAGVPCPIHSLHHGRRWAGPYISSSGA